MLNLLLNTVFKFLNWWIYSKVCAKVIHAMLIVMLLYTLLETRPFYKIVTFTIMLITLKFIINN